MATSLNSLKEWQGLYTEEEDSIALLVDKMHLKVINSLGKLRKRTTTKQIETR